MTDLPLLTPNLDDFHEAWDWLYGHPYFRYRDGPMKGSEGFTIAYDLIVVKVNPVNDRVEDDDSLNTKTNIWVECGPLEDDGGQTHDWELDCGGDTFEDAIIALAKIVMRVHGDYPKWTICSHCLVDYPSGPSGNNDVWFHSPECEEHGAVRLVTRPVAGRDDIVAMVPLSEVFGCEHFPSG